MENESEPKCNPIVRYFRTMKSQKNFFFSLVANDFWGRYKNTYLGFAWHFINPLIYIVLLYLISTELRGRDAEFVVMLASGVFIYNILLGGVTGGTGCFIRGAQMIKKIRFPREILVYSNVTIYAVVSLIMYAILLIMCAIIQHPLSIVPLLWFPVIFVLAIIFAIGMSLLLSTITVFVRDLSLLISSFTLVFFVLTPLRDTISEISGLRAELMRYNPFTYYVESMHQIFYFNSVPELWMIGIVAAVSFTALIAGALVFWKFNYKFADVL